MTTARKLRELIAAPELLVAPGAFDGITARMVEQAGFTCAYMTGAGSAASMGFPDYGLVTMTEMVQNAARMANVLSIPLVADADAGFGNELNVYRAVREYERAGVAGIHIEDQVDPKRCGHLDGKEVISQSDYIAKVRAAVDARRDPDFLIIARTDARAVTGFDDALARAHTAVDAGADMVFVEALETVDEVKALPGLVQAPALFNMVLGGKTPVSDLDLVEASGYAMAIVPGMLMRVVMRACDESLGALRRREIVPAEILKPRPADVFARVGGNEWTPRRTKYRI
ncbi:MAG: isocitrate lyase/PEP mutase family protein [Mesorhizobium sp.]